MSICTILLSLAPICQQLSLLTGSRTSAQHDRDLFLAETMTRMYLVGATLRGNCEMAEYLRDVLSDCHLKDFNNMPESILVLESIRATVASAFPRFKAYDPHCQFTYEEMAMVENSDALIIAIPHSRLEYLL